MQASFSSVSASCVDQSSNPVGTPGTNSVENIILGPQDIVNCTFYNEPDCSSLNDQCNVGMCNPTTGDCEPQPTNEGGSCNDGQYCTNPDTCQGGTCTGPLRNCNDSNVCTDDSCDDVADQCVHANNTASCYDGNACTTNDSCSGGNCVGGPPLNCNDTNVCTNDSCNPTTGCVHTNNTAPCEDGNLCTINDTCSNGTCHGGPPPNCNDGNVCTNDTCNATTGCVHTNNTAARDDGLYCTVGDACQAGTCTGTARECGDGNECMADSCDDVRDRRVNDPVPLNGASCDDGAFCTDPDTCQDGTCTGAAWHCDDGNVCTFDSCDEISDTCLNEPEPVDGNLCNDGLFCTVEDACQGGMCTGRPRDCDDGDECTLDTCDEEEDLCVNGGDPLCNMDHLKCYRTRPKGWRFAERNVMLEDQFEASEMTVERLKYFCNPTDKSGEGILNPEGHLVCYKIKDAAGQPKFSPVDLEMADQFSDDTLSLFRGDCRKSSVLCVPSTKRLASPSGAFLELTTDLLD